MMRVALLAAAALSTAACERSAPEPQGSAAPAGVPTGIAEPIKLDAGLLAAGMESSPGIHVYKGIPFAAPPVGEFRWREPQPVAAWQGTRDASEFGYVCILAVGPTEGPNARLNRKSG